MEWLVLLVFIAWTWSFIKPKPKPKPPPELTKEEKLAKAIKEFLG